METLFNNLSYLLLMSFMLRPLVPPVSVPIHWHISKIECNSCQAVKEKKFRKYLTLAYSIVPNVQA